MIGGVQGGCELASEGGEAERLAAVLRHTPVLMEVLRVARDVDPPDWLIGAGAVRDAVWDAIHERSLTAAPRNVDVAFFDPSDLTAERDLSVEAALRTRAPHLPWEAKNQAAVHLWYPRSFGAQVAPFRSCGEAVATFPETASCVGMRLLADDDMLVVAPHGLRDLFACVCRHNPTRVSARFYEQRVARKRWSSRWPNMRYLAPSSAGSSREPTFARDGRLESRKSTYLARGGPRLPARRAARPVATAHTPRVAAGNGHSRDGVMAGRAVNSVGGSRSTTGTGISRPSGSSDVDPRATTGAVRNRYTPPAASVCARPRGISASRGFRS